MSGLSPKKAPARTALQVSDDEELAGEPVKESNKKHKSESAGVVTVDVNTLRSLLQEQSKGIQDANEVQLKKAMARMEDKQQEMFQTLHQRIDGTSSKVDMLERTVVALQARLDQMEQSPKSTRASTDDQGRDRRLSLVFGGWDRGTRRPVILQDLEACLEKLGLKHLTDEAGFTTGARRSVALMNFHLREGEDHGQLKKRMFSIIKGIAGKDMLNSQERKFWVTVSKTPSERRKGSHTAWIKRTLDHLGVDQQRAEVDLEYHSGSAWVGDVQVSGADSPPPQREGLLVDERSPEKAWMEMKSLGKQLRVSFEEVEGAVLKMQR